MTTVDVFAPAKINLTLHVVGQRADGYHLLDSLVAFAGVGDRVRLDIPGQGRIDIVGPEAEGLQGGGENLIHRQAHTLPDLPAIDCTLEKNLPVSSGIGGGSADAAAFYRGAARLVSSADRADMEQPQAVAAQAAVGADVPMCILSRPLRVNGAGEVLRPVQNLPALPILLINPRVPVSTPAVFAGLQEKRNAPMSALPEPLGDAAALLPWLRLQRNDLQRPAIQQVPVIQEVLQAISRQQGCEITRMSGSGATCFGVFRNMAQAEAAAVSLRGTAPNWWVQATRLNGHELAAPQVIRETT